MTGTTSPYGLPYLTSDDELAKLQPVMQDLAEAVSSTLASFGGIPNPGAWLALPSYAGVDLAGYAPVRYAKSAVWVELRGSGTYAAGWSVGGIFGNLPPGSRPLATHPFLVYSSAGPMRVEVNPNGDVVALNSAPAGGSFSFCGIRFRID